MLGAELAYDPKIKVVPFIKYYNFGLVSTSMQSFYHIVQTRSNLLHSNNDLHLNYDLVTKLALVMNTKVVHNDILNMFKLSLRSHNDFIHWVHVLLPRLTCISSLDPKIKVVPHIKYYNFALVHTSMQGLYDIVQTWSNTLHLNDD